MSRDSTMEFRMGNFFAINGNGLKYILMSIPKFRKVFRIFLYLALRLNGRECFSDSRNM